MKFVGPIVLYKSHSTVGVTDSGDGLCAIFHDIIIISI